MKYVMILMGLLAAFPTSAVDLTRRTTLTGSLFSFLMPKAPPIAPLPSPDIIVQAVPAISASEISAWKQVRQFMYAELGRAVDHKGEKFQAQMKDLSLNSPSHVKKNWRDWFSHFGPQLAEVEISLAKEFGLSLPEVALAIADSESSRSELWTKIVDRARNRDFQTAYSPDLAAAYASKIEAFMPNLAAHVRGLNPVDGSPSANPIYGQEIYGRLRWARLSWTSTYGTDFSHRLSVTKDVYVKNLQILADLKMVAVPYAARLPSDLLHHIAIIESELKTELLTLPQRLRANDQVRAQKLTPTQLPSLASPLWETFGFEDVVEALSMNEQWLEGLRQAGVLLEVVNRISLPPPVEVECALALEAPSVEPERLLKIDSQVQ